MPRRCSTARAESLDLPRGSMTRWVVHRSWSALLFLLPLLVACDRPSVLVVGLDGAAWNVMDPLMRAGFLPTMREVVDKGVRGEYDCAPALPAIACFCPPVWMSLYTGHLFSEHRIVSDGQPASARGVKSIWRVLRDYGGTSTSVSMHNNVPPDGDFEYVLAKAGVDFVASESLMRWPPKLPRWAFFPELRSLPPGLFEELGMLPHMGERPPAWSPIARDRVAMEALRRQLRRDRTDLSVIHLHSPDKVAHVMWATVQRNSGDPLDEAALLRAAASWAGPHEAPAPFGWGPVVAPYLEIDRWLGELLTDFPFDYVILVSDHGMTRRTAPGLAGDHGPNAPDAHRGILAIRGHQVRKGRDIGTVEVTDFAPTLAYLLQLPIGDDLPGRVLEEVFVPGRLRAKPIVRVPSWEDPPVLEGALKLLRLYGDQAVD